jgi:hypothetical protein
MTDQTRHGIDIVQTRNKAFKKNIEKLEAAREDCKESVFILEAAIASTYLRDDHCLIMQKWIKEYESDIEQFDIHIQEVRDHG